MLGRFLWVAVATTPLACAATPSSDVARMSSAHAGATRSESAHSSALPMGFDVQGHRGARGPAPENSLVNPGGNGSTVSTRGTDAEFPPWYLRRTVLASFKTALDRGVDTLELDLHRTADGQLVIWRDDPWTVNDPDDMRRLIDLGLDGIITDRPDMLLALGE